ncbi:hypothetical protein [Haliangium ochraceum]|uniref:Uncharacterized protein n=1 Tax=Haliangium ochraceum (strain DSM 14365 / JCM 11303 / SMP-2) TaxID=502025 RepID=D0LY86_HALO1|nr:hypothetical protein [Haliangium ochraceum]ACY16236.1 hypothetical protein Hoch_3736 [Haliangium ochraceum DSM 14365]
MIELLCTQISADFCEIDQLAGVLLRFCRDRAELLRRAYELDDACAFLARETDRLEAWFEARLEEDWLDADELAAVAEWLRGVAMRAHDALPVSEETAAALAARAAADALDGSHGRRFAGVFRGRGVTELGPGDPFPVLRRPVRSLAHELLGGPDTELPPAGNALYELRWLRLLPRFEHERRVRLRFTAEDALADVDLDARMGVAVPGDERTALQFHSRLDGEAHVARVQLRDPAAQRDAILGLLTQADAAAVRILLLPEFSVDESIVDAIARWRAEEPRSTAIVACGGMHVSRAGERRNASAVLLPGSTSLEHRKFVPFVRALPDAAGVIQDHAEDIVTEPATVEVIMCGAWSFSVLSGEDFVAPGVDRILELLGARLVLVSTCQPEPAALVSQAQLWARRNRATVVIANHAPGDDASATAALVAYGGPEPSPRPLAHDEIEPPFLHFFHIGRSHDPDS